MIILKLERDDARTIEGYFKYWYMVCDAKAKHPDSTENQQMIFLLLKSVLIQAESKFTKRLNGVAKRFKFSFTLAEAIALNEYLLKHPIAPDRVYELQLRQQVVNTLFFKIHSSV